MGKDDERDSTVEITPEMIAAGIRAYYASSSNEERMVYRIYRTMSWMRRLRSKEVMVGAGKVYDAANTKKERPVSRPQ